MNAIKPRTVWISSETVEPPILRVLAGQDVMWDNGDTVPRTVSPYGVSPIPPGGELQHIFTTPGEYTYTVNGGFTGVISVT